MSQTYDTLPNTTFPDSIQTFKEWMNLDDTDASYYQTYMQKLAQKDTAGAKSALQAIGNYNQKIITADDFNKICDTVVAVEKFYQAAQAGTGYEFQNIINNQLVYSGVWSSTTTYKQFNMVLYTNSTTGSDVYLSLKNNNVGHAPTGLTSDQYWTKLSVAGIVNTATTWRGNWTNGTTYATGDMVAHNNEWWISIYDNNTGEPSYASNWQSVLDFNRYTPVVSVNTPSGYPSGSFWYRVLT